MKLVGPIPEELLAMPSTVAECDALLEALWAAMPKRVEVRVGANIVVLTAERAGARLLAGDVAWDDLTVDVAILVDGWVLCPRGTDSTGVPLDTLTLGAIANQIRDALWPDPSIPDLLLGMWAVRQRGVRLAHAQQRQQEVDDLRRLLCRLAAWQEPGPPGQVARRLANDNWLGTVDELLRTARAVATA
jgi:hypothetical protein